MLDETRPRIPRIHLRNIFHTSCSQVKAAGSNSKGKGERENDERERKTETKTSIKSLKAKSQGCWLSCRCNHCKNQRVQVKGPRKRYCLRPRKHGKKGKWGGTRNWNGWSILYASTWTICRTWERHQGWLIWGTLGQILLYRVVWRCKNFEIRPNYAGWTGIIWRS